MTISPPAYTKMSFLGRTADRMAGGRATSQTIVPGARKRLSMKASLWLVAEITASTPGRCRSRSTEKKDRQRLSSARQLLGDESPGCPQPVVVLPGEHLRGKTITGRKTRAQCACDAAGVALPETEQRVEIELAGENLEILAGGGIRRIAE